MLTYVRLLPIVPARQTCGAVSQKEQVQILHQGAYVALGRSANPLVMVIGCPPERLALCVGVIQTYDRALRSRPGRTP